MKNLQFVLFISFFSFIFSNCVVNNYAFYEKKMLTTKVTQKYFKQKIPVINSWGNVTVKVKIRDKYYNFILDTGAQTTVISEELSRAISSKEVLKGTMYDANQVSRLNTFFQIDTLSVADIDFTNVLASSSDLSKYEAFYCTKIDGFLGTNLLSKAVWQIDYQQSNITFANHRDSLLFAPDAKNIRFHTYEGQQTGTPIVALNINYNFICNVVFDTGAGGNIGLPELIYQKVAVKTPVLTTYHFASGFNSTIQDTTYNSMLPDLTIGDYFSLKNTWIRNGNYYDAIIGSDFLKNYIVTFDWQNQQITLSNYQDQDDSLGSDFGLWYAFHNGKMMVRSIIKNSEAEKMGLLLNDHIVTINDIDVSQARLEDFCNMKDIFLKETLKIKVKRGEKTTDFLLKKQYIKDLMK